MNKTPEMLADEHAAIDQLLKVVQDAADRYKKVSLTHAGQGDIAGMVKAHQAQTELTVNTQKLVAAVRGPVDMIFSHQEAVSDLLLCAIYYKTV
jgi:hypothetical protein